MALRRRSKGMLLLHGVVGGVLAGLVFALAMALTTALMGAPFDTPLRFIGAIVDPQALEPEYSRMQADLLGLAVHLFFSALYGVIFVYLLSMADVSAMPATLPVLFGVLYSMVLWVLNFIVLAPMLLPALGGVGPFLAAFSLSHAFYGLALGGYVAIARSEAGRTDNR